jgi:hypothetical protein
MADDKLTNLPVVSDELKPGDKLYTAEGGSTSKQVDADRVVPTIVTQDTTGAIDLNNYKGDVIILSTPTANITITFSNSLPSGRKAIIVNKASAYKITLAGSFVGSLTNNNILTLISDGTNLSADNKRTNIHTVTSANYTILDNDGFELIEVSTGASDRTIILPTLADNLGRVIQIIKTDSGAGKVILDGEGSESINGLLAINLYNKNDSVKIIASSSEWKIMKEATDHPIKQNLLVNGNFRFAQEGVSGSALFDSTTTPANNDDTYLLDQWVFLSEVNDNADISQVSDTPNNKGLALKADITSVGSANKKFGFFQPIEYEKCKDLLNKTVSLRFYAKTSASFSFSNIRASIVSWDGTADAITTDIVSAWNTSGTNPTLATNWTYENTPSNLSLTSTYKEFVINGISIDTSGMKNIGLFIWTEDTPIPVGGALYLSECALVKEDIFKNVEYRDFGIEFAMCQRYFEKSYNLDVAVGSVSDPGKVQDNASTGARPMFLIAKYAVAKRAIPTCQVYSPTDGASGQLRDEIAGANVAGQTANEGTSQHTCRTTGAGTDTNTFSVHWTSNARL